MYDEHPGVPAPAIEHCYRHPGVPTGVHCTRCGRPICPDCMIPAPVGYQCPDCVARARREFRRGPGSVRRRVSVTRALLLALIAGFVLEVLTGGPRALFEGPSSERLFDLGAMYPPAIALGQWWRLVTAMFLHAGLLHIAFNGYALWLFGNVVEDEFGSLPTALIFFVTGFLASATSYAFGPVADLGVGASGAIFGIFGAFIAYNYRRRHLAMAAANLRTAMLLIVLNALLALGLSTIDWRAHVGGLVSGVAAGFVAEGWGSARQRAVVRLVGLGALVALGVALVVWRTGELRGQLGL
ncbi:MAG TPA: rhomboid family intramembrane serine protease [Actinomycetota bacterium]|nr:rhomboid family intramembrane serine protease [Actinomycetota bacterium]